MTTRGKKRGRTPAKIPAEVPATVVAEFTGLTPERVVQLKGEGIFPTSGKGKYRFAECIRAYCEKLRGRESRAASAGADNRRKEAEAISAEVDAAKALGDVMMKQDAGALWADATIEVRRMVEEADYLDEKQKRQLLERLAKIHLAE